MNYDVRKLCYYFPNIHSRYYIDTNGTVYTSLAPGMKKIMIDGERITLTPHVNNALPFLNRTERQMAKLPFSKDYFVLYDGTILQRLKTVIKENNEVVVSLVCTDTRKPFEVSRLVAGAFIENVDGKEVHHKDNNRMNNNVDNLAVLSFYEHRGHGNFKANHNL